MSSSAYASALKILGGAFRTKNPGSAAGSGYVANCEDVAESAAPQVDPIIHVEDAEKVDDVIEVADGPERQAPKGRKVMGLSLPKTRNLL